MSNVERRVLTIIAQQIGVDTVTPTTRLHLGDRSVGGLRGLQRIAGVIERAFGVEFGKNEPELWTKGADVIAATELLVGPAMSPADCRKKRNELLAQARDAEALCTLDGEFIASRCRVLASNLDLAASASALVRERGLMLYEKNSADFDKFMRTSYGVGHEPAHT
jgi:hypothetical protein